MFIKMLKSKIHRACVTDKNVHYAGSITIDATLLEKAGLRAHEEVLVANVNTGSRHETYVLEGRRGSGEIIMNGAAGRLGEIGDPLIIMGFAYCTPEEADRLKTRVVLVDERNRFKGYLGQRRPKK